MLVLAHRGCHLVCPENTLEAFARAAAVGADGVETDLRLCRDGEVVLFHDRFAPGAPGDPGNHRRVSELSRAELSAAAGYPVPTLDEALAAFPGFFWNLEIKEPAAVGPTLERLRRLSGSWRFLVSSFWHPAVLPFAGLPGVECALLLASRPADVEALAGLFPRDGAVGGVVWSWEIADPELLAAAAARGLRAWVYGVEGEEEHRQAAALGLAGVITDRPDLLRLSLRAQGGAMRR